MAIPLKRVVHLLLPPLCGAAWRRVCRVGWRIAGTVPTAEYEILPGGFSEAIGTPQIRGWNVEEIVRTYERKWPRFNAALRGTGPLGVSHESQLSSTADVLSHNITMIFGYVLGLACRGAGPLSVLDWGGGCGHYYLLARALFPQVQFSYACKDVARLVTLGRRLVPQVEFFDSEECLHARYDLVMASVSLHYSEEWQKVLRGLAGAARHYLYIAQLPTVVESHSFVFVQRAYAYGYNTEYPGWCLNKNEFLAAARACGCRLAREFCYGYRPRIKGAPEQNEYRGFLFSCGDWPKEPRQ